MASRSIWYSDCDCDRDCDCDCDRKADKQQQTTETWVLVDYLTLIFLSYCNRTVTGFRL